MKQQGRKPPKRKRAATANLDEDLAKLALVLDESRLDNNAKGWFIPPWNDGWNAVTLAFDQAQQNAEIYWNEDEIADTARWLYNAVINRDRSNDTYWRVGELLASGVLQKRRSLYASLRCMQVLIANSHGGGHVYNDILRPIFDDIGITQRLADLVMFHRRNDAIGTKAQPRYIEAFNIAWRRGLYLAAYSLHPPVN